MITALARFDQPVLVMSNSHELLMVGYRQGVLIGAMVAALIGIGIDRLTWLPGLVGCGLDFLCWSPCWLRRRQAIKSIPQDGVMKLLGGDWWVIEMADA